MSRSPAGWYVDEADARTERWWDGSTWTGETRPAGLAAPGPRGGNGRRQGNPGFVEAAQTSVEVGLERILTAPSMGAAPPLATPPATAASHTGEEPAGRHASAIMATKVAAFVMVLLLVGGGTFLSLGRGRSAGAAVASALTSTLNNRTADLTVTGSVGLGRDGVAVSGSGTVNFTQQAAQLQLNTAMDGHQITDSETSVGDTIYLDLGPLVGRVLPGKTWISMDLSQLSQWGSASPLGIGSGLTTNNPSVILEDLGQRGNTVTALGPSEINGTAVQGYSVQVNPVAIRAALASAHLPAWLGQGVAGAGKVNVSYDVYIDDSGLLYRMSLDASVPVHGQDLSGVISIDFSNYGTATPTITPPPAAQVASYQNAIGKF